MVGGRTVTDDEYRLEIERRDEIISGEAAALEAMSLQRDHCNACVLGLHGELVKANKELGEARVALGTRGVFLTKASGEGDNSVWELNERTATS